MPSALHLASRFLGSLWPLGPRAVDHRWAISHLLSDEAELWLLMSRVDRRHAAGVARRTVALLGPSTPREVVAAALLHDVGKLDSGLGTYGRVVATVCGRVGGLDMAEAWSSHRGFTRRVGLYLRHDTLGADRLTLAGSDALTIAWAREHHLPEERWTIPLDIGRALKEADGD
ncbi:MAG: hypothetical protein AB7V43_21135 [Acidimicrobiia bacterium]